MQNSITIPELDKWWKKKEQFSTFFPNNWSEEKIKQEIAEAYVKKVYQWPAQNWWSIYHWNSLSGQKYEIIEWTDGSITTAYWIFE